MSSLREHEPRRLTTSARSDLGPLGDAHRTRDAPRERTLGHAARAGAALRAPPARHASRIPTRCGRDPQRQPRTPPQGGPTRPIARRWHGRWACARPSAPRCAVGECHPSTRQLAEMAPRGADDGKAGSGRRAARARAHASATHPHGKRGRAGERRDGRPPRRPARSRHAGGAVVGPAPRARAAAEAALPMQQRPRVATKTLHRAATGTFSLRRLRDSWRSMRERDASERAWHAEGLSCGAFGRSKNLPPSILSKWS